MKKIIIIALLFAFFSCEKNEFMPEKQALTIEVHAAQFTPELVDLTVNLDYAQYSGFESKSFQLNDKSMQIVYKKTIYIDKDEVVYLNLESNKINTALAVKAYTDYGKYSFLIIDKNELTIRLVDDAYKNVKIE